MSINWINIGTATYAASVPGGALVRMQHRNDAPVTAAALVFIPGVSVTETGDLVPLVAPSALQTLTELATAKGPPAADEQRFAYVPADGQVFTVGTDERSWMVSRCDTDRITAHDLLAALSKGGSYETAIVYDEGKECGQVIFEAGRGRGAYAPGRAGAKWTSAKSLAEVVERYMIGRMIQESTRPPDLLFSSCPVQHIMAPGLVEQMLLDSGYVAGLLHQSHGPAAQVIYNDGVGRGAIAFHDGDRWKCQWTDASSLEDVVERYFMDRMVP